MNQELIEAIKKKDLESVKKALDAGADINFVDQYGDTPLHWATHYRNSAIVKFLIKAGANINTRNYRTLTPLAWAAQEGHHVMVDVLIKGGANVNEISVGNMTALHWAASKGHADVVEVLIKGGADIKIGLANMTALDWAASCGHLYIVKVLITAETYVNPTGGTEITDPLIYALENDLVEIEKGQDNNTFEIVRQNYCFDIIQAQKSLNVTNYIVTLLKHKALIYAVLSGHIDVVKVLIEKKADVNLIGGTEDNAPLIYAVKYGQPTIVEVLIKEGADIHKTDHDGATAFHWVAHSRHAAIIAKLLITAGANINAKSEGGATPLHYALYYRNPAFAELLIKAGADISAKNPEGLAPLHLAAQNGDTATVEALLKAGSNIDAPCQGKPIVKWLEEQQKLICVPMLKAAEGLMAAAQDKTKNEGVDNLLQTLGTGLNSTKEQCGNTALHFAVEKNPELAAKLIIKGAAIDIKNKNGKTVYDFIQQAGNHYLENIVKFRSLKKLIINEKLSSTTTTLNDKEKNKQDVNEFVEFSSRSSSSSSSSSSSTSESKISLTSTSSAPINSVSHSRMMNTQNSPKTCTELATEIFAYANSDAQVSQSSGDKSSAETSNSHLTKELEIELSILVLKNIVLFPSLRYDAYNFLTKINESHPRFKEIQDLDKVLLERKDDFMAKARLRSECQAAVKKGVYRLILARWGFNKNVMARYHSLRKRFKLLNIKNEINLDKEGIDFLNQYFAEIADLTSEERLINLCVLSEENRIFNKKAAEEKSNDLFSKMRQQETRLSHLTNSLRWEKNFTEIDDRCSKLMAFIKESQRNISTGSYQPKRQNKITQHIDKNNVLSERLAKIKDVLLILLETTASSRSTLPYSIWAHREEFDQAFKDKDFARAENVCERLEAKVKGYEKEYEKTQKIKEELEGMIITMLGQLKEEQNHMRAGHREINPTPAECSNKFSEALKEYNEKMKKEQEKFNAQKHKEAWAKKRAEQKLESARLRAEKLKVQKKLLNQQRLNQSKSHLAEPAGQSYRAPRPCTIDKKAQIGKRIDVKSEFGQLKKLIEIVAGIEDKTLGKHALLGGIVRVLEMAKRIRGGVIDESLSRTMRNHLFHDAQSKLLKIPHEDIFGFALELCAYIAPTELKGKNLDLNNIGSLMKSKISSYFTGESTSSNSSSSSISGCPIDKSGEILEELSLNELIKEIEETKKQLVIFEKALEKSTVEIKQGKENINALLPHKTALNEACCYLASRLDAFRTPLRRQVQELQKQQAKQDNKLASETYAFVKSGIEYLKELRKYSKLAKTYRHGGLREEFCESVAETKVLLFSSSSSSSSSLLSHQDESSPCSSSSSSSTPGHWAGK